MYSKFPISDDHIGRRLDNFVVAQLRIPKALVYKLIRKGGIKVLKEEKQKKVAVNYKIMQGDSLYLPEALTRDAVDNKTNYTVKHQTQNAVLSEEHILLENSDYIIIDKPYNLAVQGGTNINITLLDMVQNTFGDRVYLGHRLDRATSGCILLAKNYPALRHFHNQLTERLLEKKYIAIVSGTTADQWTVNTPIIVNGKAQQALSQFATIGQFTLPLKQQVEKHNCSLIWASPVSGRKHQLRIHLKTNHPIMGDDKYGDFALNKKITNSASGLMLHAHSLSFSDRKGNAINIKSRLPMRFNNLLAQSNLSMAIVQKKLTENASTIFI